MKKYITIIICTLIITFSLSAQGQYESGMNQAIKLESEGKYTEAIALYERIGQAEKEDWIPLYHAANLLIESSFEAKEKSTKNDMLAKAKTIIESAHERSSGNSEITTLEGKLYLGYVAMDPMNNGMKYSGKIMQLHSKAIALDPENPRALSNKIEFEMGTAKFFGEDLSSFCEEMKKIIPKFENQKLSKPFAPSYGIERAKAVSESCK